MDFNMSSSTHQPGLTTTTTTTITITTNNHENNHSFEMTKQSEIDELMIEVACALISGMKAIDVQHYFKLANIQSVYNLANRF